MVTTASIAIRLPGIMLERLRQIAELDQRSVNNVIRVALFEWVNERGCVMKFYKLTERYTGERDVYVYASSKADALVAARNGDSVDEGEPTHFDYRYVGPVEEVVPDGER